jgi:hypothetical protein
LKICKSVFVATLEKWDLVLYGTEASPTGTPRPQQSIPSEIRDNALPDDNGRRFGGVGDAAAAAGASSHSSNAGVLGGDGDADDPPYGDFRFPDPPHNPSEFAGQVDSSAASRRPGASHSCLALLVFTFCLLIPRYTLLVQPSSRSP